MSASDYRKRLEAVLRETDERGYRFINATITTEDLRSLLSEAESLRADITGLEDGNMTWMCDQLDKAKAENAAQAVELERMRDLVGDLERRAQACDDLFQAATDGLSQYRLGGKADAYRHAADLARVALSVKAG